jgi:L-ascorbate metabolism protein UlaG (beta-lactamase superfamily)
VTTTLDWYGCATFRLRTAGLTIFLDAYIDRAPHAEGAGRRADDVDECDWIVVGHSHFDHLWGAERIAANTGARVIGSYETVRVLEHLGVPLDRMICASGGERVDLGNGVSVSVYPSLHSCLWTGTHGAQSDEVCLGDLGVTWQERAARMDVLGAKLATTLDPAALEHLLAAMAGHSNRGDGGALVYLFETPEGTVLFQDTSGHWSPILATLSPDVAILAAAGRGNVDGEPVQGSLASFVAAEAAAVGARQVVLCHHDDWLPGFGGAVDVAPIRDALAAAAPATELLQPGYVDGTVLFA